MNEVQTIEHYIVWNERVIIIIVWIAWILFELLSNYGEINVKLNCKRLIT
jgi:hypothetical protein